jgi:hypothetical protein
MEKVNGIEVSQPLKARLMTFLGSAEPKLASAKAKIETLKKLVNSTLAMSVVDCFLTFVL